MDEQRTSGEQTEQAATWLDLHDWRLRVARLYAERAATDPLAARAVETDAANGMGLSA